MSPRKLKLAQNVRRDGENAYFAPSRRPFYANFNFLELIWKISMSSFQWIHCQSIGLTQFSRARTVVRALAWQWIQDFANQSRNGRDQKFRNCVQIEATFTAYLPRECLRVPPPLPHLILPPYLLLPKINTSDSFSMAQNQIHTKIFTNTQKNWVNSKCQKNKLHLRIYFNDNLTVNLEHNNLVCPLYFF